VGAESDVSQVDVGSAAPATNKPPAAYQVVSEERFRAYERTGVLPTAEPAPVPAAATEPAEDGDKSSASASADEN
jgi:hypothetical protein